MGKVFAKLEEKTYYPVKLNMPTWVYTALAVSEHMQVCGQHTSVNCHRYTELTQIQLILGNP